MRLIGHLPTEVSVVKFGDHLLANGIKNHLEAEKDGTWAVWIYSEEDLPLAKDFLAHYLANPNDPKLRHAAQKAREVLESETQDFEAFKKRTRSRREIWASLTVGGIGPLTLVLIGISIGVAIYSKIPLLTGSIDGDTIRGLWITYSGGSHSLPEIQAGQVWRLITPIFIHMNLLHIVFNLLWLRDLGSMIEQRQSSWRLLALVVVIAALSNLGQFRMSGPSFGGMSGVVYGLLGYVWIRGKFDPASGLFLHRETVTMMILWFFLCFTGALGPIANTAHAVGLGVGIAWGFLSSLPSIRKS